jgi:ribonucleoside-diphosphate reductase alpha chain
VVMPRGSGGSGERGGAERADRTIDRERGGAERGERTVDRDRGSAALSSPSPLVGEGRGGGSGSRITALATSAARGQTGGHSHNVEGTAALKSERAPSPTEALDKLPWSPARTDPRAEARALAAEKRAEAKAQGFEGEACGECGNFTLVRNGTCLKCNTCGSTTGCS